MSVLLVASHGGHWIQLQRLAPAFVGSDIRFVTTNSEFTVDSSYRLSIVQDANLNEKLALIKLAWQIFLIVIKDRPDVVCSTGAAPGFFALMFGKLIGARTIWVDSLANAQQLSVSGKKVKPFADLWLTQWKELSSPDGPQYRGSVV